MPSIAKSISFMMIVGAGSSALAAPLLGDSSILGGSQEVSDIKLLSKDDPCRIASGGLETSMNGFCTAYMSKGFVPAGTTKEKVALCADLETRQAQDAANRKCNKDISTCTLDELMGLLDTCMYGHIVNGLGDGVNAKTLGDDVDDGLSLGLSKKPKTSKSPLVGGTDTITPKMDTTLGQTPQLKNVKAANVKTAGADTNIKTGGNDIDINLEDGTDIAGIKLNSPKPNTSNNIVGKLNTAEPEAGRPIKAVTKARPSVPERGDANVSTLFPGVIGDSGECLCDSTSSPMKVEIDEAFN